MFNSEDPMLDRAKRISRLKSELKDHIRFLNSYEFLSDTWLRMVDSLGQLAQVAVMECHFPNKERSPLLQEGKNDEGTLWDQERDQLSVRTLMEEGKLNLCLRILHEFSHKKRSPEYDDLLNTAAKVGKLTKADLITKCELFEVSLGSLIKFTLQYMESVQIVDLPELMEHIAEVLLDSLQSDVPEDTKRSQYSKKQEGAVIHYLHATLRREESIDDDRVMLLVHKNNLIALLAAHLCKCYKYHDFETLGLAAQAYHLMFCSDAFGADKKMFINTESVKRDLVALKGLFVSELVAKYGLEKKSVRKLLDHILRWERVVGKSVVIPLSRET